MSDERVRLFAALELPAEVRAAVVHWREEALAAVPELRDAALLRALAAPALHVTLCFLGWRMEREVAQIAAACESVASSPAPALSLGEAVWLPTKRPRVLAVELRNVDGRLARVQAALSQALAEGALYMPEKRSFLPHVTVARVAKSRRLRAHQLIGLPPLRFTGERVTLFRSLLTREGARYEPLHSVELTPKP